MVDRSSALRTAREKRMADWFGTRHWRVCTELTFETDDLDVQAGEFWVKGGKVFRTPFGNKGSHGYIIQEVNPDTGEDVWDKEKNAPSRASFGWVTLNSAAEMFPGSVDVPPRPYGQPGGLAAGRAGKDVP
jgi:hypothetical protein